MGFALFAVVTLLALALLVGAGGTRVVSRRRTVVIDEPVRRRTVIRDIPTVREVRTTTVRRSGG